MECEERKWDEKTSNRMRLQEAIKRNKRNKKKKGAVARLIQSVMTSQ